MKNLKFVMIIIAMTIAACKPASSSQKSESGGKWAANVPVRSTAPEVCAAVRGNGHFLFAHWTSLARSIELFGPIEGIAGGSSAVITSFLYESMYGNAAVWTCDEEGSACTKQQAANRLAFLMKSLSAYLEVLFEESGASHALTVSTDLYQEFQTEGISTLVEQGQWLKALTAMHKVLSSPEFSGLIQPALLDRLERSKANETSAAFIVREVFAAIQSLQWQIDSEAVFFRQGLFDFDILSDKIGALADFYAGSYSDEWPRMQKLLSECSESSVGKLWEQIDVECDQGFRQLVKDFRINYTNKSSYVAKRIQEDVGQNLVSIMTTSSFSKPEALTAFAEANKSYHKDQPAKLNFDFDWVEYSYWAQQSDLDRILSLSASRTDLKSRKANSLGQRPWGEILRVSPREPGLDSALCLTKEGQPGVQGEWKRMSALQANEPCLSISTGGWSDLEPTQVLRDVGCRNIVYVTRQGGPSAFATTMVEFLSKDTVQKDQVLKELYDLKDQQNPSSFSRALSAADFVWCTDWDNVPQDNIGCLLRQGYEGWLITDRQNFESGNYSKTLHGRGYYGCYSTSKLDEIIAGPPC